MEISIAIMVVVKRKFPHHIDIEKSYVYIPLPWFFSSFNDHSALHSTVFAIHPSHADSFRQSKCSTLSITITHTLLAQPSGPTWGLVSCPRTLRHTALGDWDLLVSEQTTLRPGPQPATLFFSLHRRQVFSVVRTVWFLYNIVMSWPTIYLKVPWDIVCTDLVLYKYI